MHSGTPLNSNHLSTSIAASPYLRGASDCWESVASKNRISATTNSDITPLQTNSKSPLGLSLFTEPSLAAELADSPFSARHLIDGLLTELALRAKTAGKRGAPWLRWQIPHALLDSADVMELMYFIGKQFQLGDSSTCHYSVCFSAHELDTKRAALFKGLGFTCLELQLLNNEKTSSNTTCESEILDQLSKAGGICQDYHYPNFALHIDQYCPCLTSALSDLQKTQSRLPDIVNITSCEFPSPKAFQQTFDELKNLGYRVLGNDCFVRSGTSLANAQINHHLKLSAQGYNCQNVTDIIGLGPGNHSTLSHAHYQNPSSLPSYLANPQGERFMTATPDARAKLVIDYLLCYHQLDLRYFEDRYGLNLKTILESAWGPLENNPHLRLSNHRLHLTEQGIAQLTPLCQLLIGCFC